MPHPSLERLDEIAALTARAEKAEAEVGRLRAALLNIQAIAERGFPLDASKLAERCRHVLKACQQNAEDGK